MAWLVSLIPLVFWFHMIFVYLLIETEPAVAFEGQKVGRKQDCCIMESPISVFFWLFNGEERNTKRSIFSLSPQQTSMRAGTSSVPAQTSCLNNFHHIFFFLSPIFSFKFHSRAMGT